MSAPPSHRILALPLLLLFVAAAPSVRADHADVARPEIVDALPPGRSVANRLDEIRDRIHGVLEYPALARSRELEGEVKVAFEIGGERRAIDVELSHSSGHAILDRAALRAVETADRLPMVYGRLVIPIAFDLREH
ncbi:MAG: energy transducer TonB [Myxococcales bacterium]|nr:energy transducer TonB [Myxococcales bacterium]